MNLGTGPRSAFRIVFSPQTIFRVWCRFCTVVHVRPLRLFSIYFSVCCSVSLFAGLTFNNFDVLDRFDVFDVFLFPFMMFDVSAAQVALFHVALQFPTDSLEKTCLIS